MNQSAYIHIPFCENKCNYCSFVSFTGSGISERKDYIDTLIQEIKHFYKNEPLKTLYFGGGTPSLVETNDLRKVIECFDFDDNAEITIEVNPETVDFDYLKSLRETGFNRLSIGIQSFDDEILKNIGRIHSAEKAIQTVKNAKKAGFSNISTDFIYGLPNQTQNGFINDLNTAVELEAEHISLYGLKIEEGCKFYKNTPKDLPDDDMQADMYIAAIDFLKSKGFNHYEISNFAKIGCESRHNLNYWNCREYYGFGVAAHGYVDGKRYSNFENTKNYKEHYTKKQASNLLSEQEKLEEHIYLGFRKGEGINVLEINQKFDIDFEKLHKKTLDKYINSKHILKTPKGYKFNTEGFLLSNVILSDFI